MLLTRHAEGIAVYTDPKAFSSGTHDEVAPQHGADSALFVEVEAGKWKLE